jgi:hypothetical protein
MAHAILLCFVEGDVRFLLVIEELAAPVIGVPRLSESTIRWIFWVTSAPRIYGSGFLGALPSSAPRILIS